MTRKYGYVTYEYGPEHAASFDWVVCDYPSTYIAMSGWLMFGDNTVTGVREKNNFYWFK